MFAKNLINKIGGLSSAVKASLVLMLTQFVQQGLNLLTTPIYTRLLTTEQFGQASLFFSWYEIMLIFTELCLSKGVFNNGMLDFREDRDGFSFSLYSLTFFSTLIIGTVVTLFCAFIWNFIGLPLHLVIYMFVLQAFQGALAIWSVRQRFEFKYKALAVVTISIAVVSQICGILGIILFDSNPVDARIIGARNIFLIAYIAIFAILLKKARGRVKKEYWIYALKFNLPIIPHYLSLHILNHMDRIQIAAISGEASAGIYSLAYSGASIVKLFWTSINASLIPWTYEQCEKKQFKRIDSLTRILILGYAMICLIVMFLAPEVIKILATDSYSEGIYVIPSVIMGVYFSSLYFIFANVIYYYKKPQYVMIGSCVSAVINVVLNAVLIPIFGYFAAGYTTLASYLLQVIIDYLAMRKVVDEKIYDMRYIIGISIAVVVIGLLLNLIYGYMILRYILLLLLVVSLSIYVYKKKGVIIQLIKKGREI